MIDSVDACRQRERERGNSTASETLGEKIRLGRNRIIQHVERRLYKEFSADKKLIRLRECNLVKQVKQVKQHDKNNARLIREAAPKLGVRPNTIYKRLEKGWPLDRALTVPRHARNTKTGIYRRFLDLFPYDWTPVEAVKGFFAASVDQQVFVQEYERRKNYDQSHGTARAEGRSEDQKVKSGVGLCFGKVKQYFSKELEFDGKSVRRINKP
jgi:hypothetical protein